MAQFDSQWSGPGRTWLGPDWKVVKNVRFLVKNDHFWSFFSPFGLFCQCCWIRSGYRLRMDANNVHINVLIAKLRSNLAFLTVFYTFWPIWGHLLTLFDTFLSCFGLFWLGQGPNRGHAGVFEGGREDAERVWVSFGSLFGHFLVKMSLFGHFLVTFGQNVTDL